MWYDGRRGYIAIGGTDGVWLMNAAAPKLEGTRGGKMANGKYILEIFIDTVRDSDGGLATYDFPKPGTIDPLTKLTLVRKFAPWDLIRRLGSVRTPSPAGQRKLPRTLKRWLRPRRS